MKIAQIAPIWYSVPPRKSPGGIEVFLHSLIEELVKEQHDVTLFASADSHTSAKLVSFFPQGVGEDIFPAGKDFFLYQLRHISQSLEYIKKEKFDIIHCHFGSMADFILLELIKDLPHAIVTLHQLLPDPNNPLEKNKQDTFEYYKNIKYVSISEHQRTMNLNYVANIYNGLNTELYTPNFETNADHMIWFSRITEKKGLKEAVIVSKESNKKLLYIGGINNQASQEYFDSMKHLIDPILINGTTNGSLNQQEKNMSFANAKLFLFPILWEEPFGLVMIESMASGTPVVAFARGAAPEIIQDGITGFLVNPSDDDIRGEFITKKTGIDGLKEAVEKIYSLSPEKYRDMRIASCKNVEERFTIERMTKEYISVYKQISQNNKSF